MKRTISIMAGDGVVNHNLRIYHAENTDPERSHMNIHYCHENIKKVYEEHLNVLDYKKKMRMQEVTELEQAIDEKHEEYGTAVDSLKKVYDRIQTLQEQEQLIEKETRQYDQPEWSLPEPSALMSAKSYKEKQAQPLIAKLKKALKAAVSRYHALVGQLRGLQRSLGKANASIDNLTELVYEERRISSSLKEKLQDYKLLRRFLGEDRLNSMLEQARTELEAQKRKKRTQNMNYER